MKRSVRRVVRIGFFVLLLGGLIALIAFGIEQIIRQLVVLPISYLAWLADAWLKSFPQAALWGVLIVILVVIAVRSMKWEKPPKAHTNELLRLSENGYNPTSISSSVWLRRLQMVNLRLHSRPYFNRQIASLFVEVEAFRLHNSSRSLKSDLLDGTAPLPASVRQWLIDQEAANQSRLRPPVWIRLWNWITSLANPAPRSHQPVIGDTEAQIIQYLENELEISDAHRYE